MFTLTTKSVFQENSALFSSDGNVIGRIIHKSPKFKGEYDEHEYEGTYSYHIKVTKANIKVC